MLSEALALSEMVPSTVAPAAGALMFTVGGVVSTFAASVVSRKFGLVVALVARSVARTKNVYCVAAVRPVSETECEVPVVVLFTVVHGQAPVAE